MPPPQTMGHSLQNNNMNKPVNPFQASQQQQNMGNNHLQPNLQNNNNMNMNKPVNPFQPQQQNKTPMGMGNNQMGGQTMNDNMQFPGQGQNQMQGQNSMNPNLNMNQNQNLQQGMQAPPQLHFEQQQHQNVMTMNHAQIPMGPTPEQIALERIREQEEIVMKSRGLFEKISDDMMQRGLEFDTAKDNFAQRRKELLFWIKKKEVRDLGNSKKIYKQLFDDSVLLDLRMKELALELQAKVDIIDDTQNEDAHSENLKKLMSRLQKGTENVNRNIETVQRYMETQEKILSVTPGLEPRKIEYKETEGDDTIQFFSQGSSKLGRGSLTKSFKQSLGGHKNAAAAAANGLNNHGGQVNIFENEEMFGARSAKFPRFDRAHEQRKKAQEERLFRVQEISKALFEGRTSDIEEITKRLKKVKKQLTTKQREVDISKHRIVFEDLSDEDPEDGENQDPNNRSPNQSPNKSMNESLAKSQVSYEKIDKFFSQILLDLSSKYHFDEILQSQHQSYDFQSSDIKPKNALINKVSTTRLHEPTIHHTTDFVMNNLLLKARNAKRVETGSAPVIFQETLREDIVKIKKAEAELEQEKLALEAQKKLEEIEAEQTARAKKKAEEEAARQRREMEEAQKKAQQARLAQEQMAQRKAQEEAKKMEQKPPQPQTQGGQGQVQTQLQFQKPTQNQPAPAASLQANNKPAAGPTISTGPVSMNNGATGKATGNTGNPALDDTVVIDDNNNQGAGDEVAPGGNILPADILGNDGGNQDPFIKEMMGNTQMGQGEIEALNRAKQFALSMRQDILRQGLNPDDAVFIVTLKNLPRGWNDETLKQNLTQMKRRFANLKVELKSHVNTGLVKVVGFRDAILLYILNEQNIDGFVIQTEMKAAQKQPGKPMDNQNSQAGFPAMQSRTIRTITNPLPINPNNQMNPQMSQQMNPQQQQQQVGGNRFQTNAFQSPDQTLRPKFGQSTHIGQSPGFGQAGFGQGNPFMQQSPGLGGNRPFGQGGMKFGQTGGGGFGQQPQGMPIQSPGMNQGGGFGGFGGQGGGQQQQQQQQQFMGFQGAVQQNQMQGNGGFGGQPSMGGGSAADFFGASRR